MSRLIEMLSAQFSLLVERLRSPLYRNSLYVLGATGASAISGFVFWMIAARVTSPAEVGTTQGALAAVGLLKSIGDFGLSVAVIYYASSQKENVGPLINTVIAAGWISSFAIASGFVLGIPLWAPGLIVIREDLILMIAFIGFAAVDSLLNLQDAAMLSQKRGDYVFWRNLACNLPPIVIVFILTRFSEDVRTLFIAYTLPNLIVGLIIGKYVLPQYFDGYRFFGRFDRSIVARIASYGIANHAGNLLWSIPSFVLPIISVNVLLPELSGYFNTNWLLFTFLLIIPRSVTLSMFVEGASEIEQLVPIALRSMAMIVILSFPIVVFLALFGRYILQIFGDDYAEHVDTLRILLFSVVPFAINSVFFVMLRVRKQLTLVVFFAGGVSASIVVFVSILAESTNLNGIALGWFIGQSVPAVIVTLLGLSVSWVTFRRKDPSSAVTSP